MNTRPIVRPSHCAAHEDFALADVKDVMAITRFGKTWLRDAVADGRFPAPAIRGHRVMRWRLADVRRWVEAQGLA